jgi:hypothetical protein
MNYHTYRSEKSHSTPEMLQAKELMLNEYGIETRTDSDGLWVKDRTGWRNANEWTISGIADAFGG